MNSIIDQLNISPDDAIATARKQYVSLLRTENDASDGNRQTLLVTAHVLGKTVDQVKADVLVMRRVKQLEALAASVQQKITDATQAAKAIEAHDAESTLIQAKRVEARKTIATQLAVARGNETEAKNADLELQQLRNSNPDLLA